MSNDLMALGNTALSPAMQKYLAEKGGMSSELGAGVTAGFAVVTYRGKTWSIKHRGEETMQMRADGDGPKSSVEFVIVKAAANISKIFYINGYVEGSSAPPDCWSVDGVKPDAASPAKQSSSCAGCPMNQWGSHITPAGKKAKRCTDSKRLAVVPADDVENKRYGGPMLMRVPAASLGDMATYDANLMSKGFPYFAVQTRISFDPQEAFPKLVFNPVKPLTDEDAVKVLEMREGEQVARILSAPVEEVTADVASADGGSPANQSLSQRAAAQDPAVAEAARQAAVKAAQEAAQKAAGVAAQAKPEEAAKPEESVEERIRREVEAKIMAEQEAKAKAEAEARAKAEAEAKAKAEAEKAAQAETPEQMRERLEREMRAKIEAEMAAKTATGGQAVAFETKAATPVAANSDTPSTATAAASDVVDAEYKETQNTAAAPGDFDSLLDSMLGQ